MENIDLSGVRLWRYGHNSKIRWFFIYSFNLFIKALVALFELPTNEDEDDQLIDVMEDTYQPAYCQLASARQDIPDILKGILINYYIYTLPHSLPTLIR